MNNVEAKIDALLHWMNATGPAKTSAYVSPKLVVKDTAFSGRGLYAKESVHRQEDLLRIPPRHLLNFSTAVAHITAHNPDVSLTLPEYQGLLVAKTPPTDRVTRFYSTLSLATLAGLSLFQIIAMYLMLESRRGEDSYWKPFLDMLPPIADLAATPLVWHTQFGPLWRLLPRSATKHLEQVIARYEKDLAVVEGLTQDLFDHEKFLWAWMAINSRCLYMEVPQKKTPADNFTLAPYVDFINHLPYEQCVIKIDTFGFHVHTTCAYAPGDELYFSYGPHSNEFLFCEYGFLLLENKWNYVDVTEYILVLMSPAQTQFLKLHDYYGGYTLNCDGPSFRTEIALAVLQEPAPEASRKLQTFLDGLSDGQAYQRQSNVRLASILKLLITTSDKKIQACKEVEADHPKELVDKIVQLHSDTRSLCESLLSNIK